MVSGGLPLVEEQELARMFLVEKAVQEAGCIGGLYLKNERILPAPPKGGYWIANTSSGGVYTPPFGWCAGMYELVKHDTVLKGLPFGQRHSDDMPRNSRQQRSWAI